MTYYCSITFILWLFGGWCGLHHFYLGRDKHGFLWATSFGGFILGWWKDFSRLGAYTEEANNPYKATPNERPSKMTTVYRFLGFFIFSMFYRRIFLNAIPFDEFSSTQYNILVLLIAPLGVTFTTYIISNIGHTKCSIKYPMVGAYVGEILFGHIHLVWEDTNVILVILCSAIPCMVYWRKRQEKIKMKLSHRIVLWGCMGLLFCGLWTSYCYYNVEIYVEELDEEVKLRDILNDIFNSPEWAEMRKEFKNAILLFWDTGGDYDKTWFLIQEGVATSRIYQAIETMEFDRTTMRLEKEITEEVLTKRYRELSRKWHPDKHNVEEKEIAQEKFIEIQKAYETLKTVITRKTKTRKTEL